VEIQFGSFQNASGGLAPFHVQKYFQGSLMLDLTVTSVLLNSGVPASDFALPTAQGRQQ
jgi:hypothetical protein